MTENDGWRPLSFRIMLVTLNLVSSRQLIVYKVIQNPTFPKLTSLFSALEATMVQK